MMTPDDLSSCDVDELLALMPWARRLAGRLVQAPELADDLAQDACVAALEGRSFRVAQRQGESQAKAWLSSVARKLAYKSHRGGAARRAREREASKPEGVNRTPEDEVAQMQMQRRLTEAVLDLDEPYRSTMILRFLNELSYAQIAERHSVSEAAVRQRVSRGLSQLRERLESDFGGDRSAMCLALVLFQRSDEAALSAAVAGSALPIGVLAVGLKTTLTLAALLLVALGVWFMQSRSVGGERSKENALEPTIELETPEHAISTPESSSRELAAASDAIEEESGVLVNVDRVHDLHGRVLDQEGAPVQGAEVIITKRPARTFLSFDPQFNETEHQFGHTLTDARGEFKVYLPLGNPFEVQFRHEEYATLKAGPRQPGEFFEVRLAAETILVGRVAAAENGSPVPDCLVRGVLIDDTKTSLFETRTDRNGEYRVEGLQAGRIRISVKPRAHNPIFSADVVLPAGGIFTRDFQVEESLTIRGRVVDAITKEPIANAFVSDGMTHGDAAQTDSEGRFFLEGFSSSGLTGVFASAFGYASVGLPLPGSSDGEMEVDFELPRGWRLTGRLENEQGQAVRGAYVVAISEYKLGPAGDFVRPDRQATHSDEHGRFEIASLRRDLSYLIFIRAEELAVVLYDIPGPAAAEVVVEVGTLELRSGAQILGIVTDDQGLPAPATRVTLIGNNADRGKLVGRPSARWLRHPENRVVLTDDLGRFRFGDVSPGTYQMFAGAASTEQPERVVIATSETLHEVNLKVASGLTISGSVVNELEQPIPRVFVLAFHEDDDQNAFDVVQSDVEGLFRFTHAEPGLYRLKTNSGFSDIARQYADATLEEVSAGSQENTLVLTPALATSGRVQWTDGTPVVRAVISIEGEANGMVSPIRTDQEGRFSLGLAPGRVVDLLVRTSESAIFVDPDAPRTIAAGITAGSEEFVIELERAD